MELGTCWNKNALSSVESRLFVDTIRSEERIERKRSSFGGQGGEIYIYISIELGY